MYLEIIKNTVAAAKEATKFRMAWVEEVRYASDKSALNLIGKIRITCSTMLPWQLIKWSRMASSVNHGRWILNATFPASDNPEPFNSTPDMIVLNEIPIQVLGWEDVKHLKAQGVEEGLDRDLIDIGFNRRAEERGIDLEFFFHHTPPTTAEYSATIIGPQKPATLTINPPGGWIATFAKRRKALLIDT